MTAILKLGFAFTTIGFALFAAGSMAMASDPYPASDCAIAGAVWGNYTYTKIELDDGLSGESDSHAPALNGAGVLVCGSWNIQLESGLSLGFASDDGVDGQSFAASAGGKLFWREPDIGALGAFASYDFLHFEDDDPGDEAHLDFDSYEIGLFGQYFAGDALTIGLSGGFGWESATDNSGPVSFDDGETTTWFVSAAAKHYATPRLALVLNGGFSNSELQDSSYGLETISVGGGAEYLFADCGLSIFAGGRANFHTLNFEGDEGPDIEVDAHSFAIFAGLRYDFGPVPNLVQRDRTGPISLSLLP